MQIDIIAYITFATLFGLVFCIFGSRYFRILFTFAAFLAGLLITYQLAGVYFTTVIAKAAISLTGGLILALVLNILHHIGRFIFGVLAAFLAGVLIINIVNISKITYVWDALMLLCLVFGVTAVNKQSMIRLSTAFVGAFVLSLVVFYIIHGINAQDFQSIVSVQICVKEVLVTYPYYIPGSVAVLTVAGLFFQFWQNLRFIPGQPNRKRKALSKNLMLPEPKEGEKPAEELPVPEFSAKDIDLS